ncbi:hypothetical protein MPUL_51410 [Mycolicibacterium pulveris]|uniref:Uncharacterized protein n=1 Tax=Mycolicibacterium pulveris TaxID=36813 RepID=A0A7I7USZ4_MYCPV|nr:hypothetical protein MPUL_51410 [Mycolicibacterium pulveris]
MGGHHHDPLARRQPSDQLQNFLDLDEIQVGRGFVGQNQRRIQRNRAGDRDPLLLTAAEITGTMVQPVVQADPRQQLIRAFGRRAPRHARRAQRHHDVLPRGQARHQVERLEDDADAATSRFRPSMGRTAYPALAYSTTRS